MLISWKDSETWRECFCYFDSRRRAWRHWQVFPEPWEAWFTFWWDCVATRIITRCHRSRTSLSLFVQSGLWLEWLLRDHCLDQVPLFQDQTVRSRRFRSWSRSTDHQMPLFQNQTVLNSENFILIWIDRSTDRTVSALDLCLVRKVCFTSETLHVVHWWRAFWCIPLCSHSSRLLFVC